MRLGGRRILRTPIAIPRPARTLARLATASVAALVALPATAATVEVVVEGADPGTSVSVALCQGGLSEEACSLGQELTARGGTVNVVFRDVPAGRYAVAAFEDVNGNRKLDRTGLGLPIVKGLVDLHGGNFTLKSKPREGTEVIVTLPASRVMDTLAAVAVGPEPEKPAASVRAKPAARAA